MFQQQKQHRHTSWRWRCLKRTQQPLARRLRIDCLRGNTDSLFSALNTKYKVFKIQTLFNNINREWEKKKHMPKATSTKHSEGICLEFQETRSRWMSCCYRLWPQVAALHFSLTHMTPSTNSDILLGVSSSSFTYNARPLPPAPLFLEHRGPSLCVQVITCHHDYSTTATCFSPGLY